MTKKIYIKYEFIHMCGKKNYNKTSVIRQIRDSQSLFKASFKGCSNFVIYCFDVDTNGNKNISFIEEVKRFCQKEKYELVIAYKEIESVFNLNGNDSKASKVKRFARHYPKKSDLILKNFSIPFDKVLVTYGTTNFKIVVDGILDLYRC